MRANVVVLLLGLSACLAPDSSPSPTVGDPPASTTTASVSETTSAADMPSLPGDPDLPCTGGAEPFTDAGTIGSGGVTRSDAAVIEALTWESYEGCQRIRFSFATPEGAPAVSTPIVGAEFIRHAGVVRIEFATSVTETAIVEQVLDTELAARVYVFGSVAGTLVADLHLASPAFARLGTENSPAALVIDLVPGGGAFAAPAIRSEELVVFVPDPAATGYPITLTGYAAPETFERLEGRLVASDGSVITAAASVASATVGWGGFAMVFPDGPGGPVTISVEDGPSLTLTLP